jgi:hypothetical protein
MSTPTAQVRVSLDKAQAERDAESFSSTLRSSFTDLASGANLANRAFDYMQQALGGVVSFMREGIIASAEAAAGEARLEQALRVRGIATEGVVDAVNAYNAATMQATGIADDQLLALQTQLVALGVHRDRLQEATTAAIGLSEISGKGLVQSGTIVARVLDGQVSSLTRYKAGLSSTAEAMEFLTSRASLAGSTLNTSAGQWALLTQNIGELGEALGDPVARSEGVIGGLKAANEALLGFTSFMGTLADGAAEAAGSEGLGAFATTSYELATMGMPDLLSVGTEVVDMFRDMGREAKLSLDAAKRMAEVRETLAANARANAAGFGKSFVSQIAGTFFTGDEAANVNADSDFTEAMARITEQERRVEEAAQRERDRIAAMVAASGAGISEFIGSAMGDGVLDAAIARADTLQALAQQHAETMRQIETDANEQRFQDQLDAFDYEREVGRAHGEAMWQQEREAGEARTDSARGLLQNAIGLTQQFGTALASSMGAALKTGADAGDIAQQVLGGVVSAIGGSLVAMGTAALTAAALGTAAPWLWGITGGPFAIPAAVATIAAGLAMSVGGGYLAANAPKAPSTGSGGRSRGGSSSRTEADNQTFGSGGGPVNSTFIVQVNGGIWGQDSPRALRDMLESGDRLRPERRRW